MQKSEIKGNFIAAIIICLIAGQAPKIYVIKQLKINYIKLTDGLDRTSGWMCRNEDETSGIMGKLTKALITVVAVSIFALPTMTSVYHGQYTYLMILVMLLAIIVLLILTIMQKTSR